MTQSVTISTVSWAGGANNAVQAKVEQQQPYLLAGLFLTGKATITSTATAAIQTTKPACILGLSGTKVSGASELKADNCSFTSNGSMQFASAPSFKNSAGALNQGWTVSAAGGCKGSCTIGVPHNYATLPATNPFAYLDNSTAFSAITGTQNPCPGLNGKNPPPCTITPLSTARAYGDLTVSTGQQVTFQSGGTYFFYNANIKITGGTVQGTNINIVLLGSSTLTINGADVKLSANKNNTDYPVLNDMLIYQKANSSKSATINGNSGSTLDGAIYMPNTDLSLSGTASTTTRCLEIVAATVTIQGTYALDSADCPASLIPRTQAVVLVQ